MGLFGKKKKGEMQNVASGNQNIPQLPQFPELPNLNLQEPLPQLPSFPNNSLGEKFSQDTIKKAVTGKKEDEEVSADEFELPKLKEVPTMQKPLTKNYEDYEEEEYEEDMDEEEMPPMKPQRHFQSMTTRKAEPVFIRLDKFEESMRTFEKIKDQISEIEHLIRDTKELKAKEEEELSSWENEIQTIKNEIEKINQEIFSKI